MKTLLSTFLLLSLAFSQTVVVPVPGERQTPPSQGGSGGQGIGLGAVVGAVIGGLILSLIFSKAVPAKGQEGKMREGKERMPLFVPFEFVVVYRGSLPPGLEVLEEAVFEDFNFSLVRWERSQKELEEELRERVLFLQPNFLYELMGESVGSVSPSSISDKAVARACLLDTGADAGFVGTLLERVENHLRSPYRAEDHGTASLYLMVSRGVGVHLHRVCSEGRCTSFAVAKALVSCFREGLRVVSTPFGMYGEDRLNALIISSLSRRGLKVVAPVGNEPSDVLPFPARHPAVIKVAGDPCFPKGLCENFPREPYRVKSVGVGGVEKSFVGTSFSSVLHAVKLALSSEKDK
ncbi:MAG: S8/S53 family peptidase [Aquificaceae bacterium]|nr:S8/S53 family peptidase [Aquificaceae bacterium]